MEGSVSIVLHSELEWRKSFLGHHNINRTLNKRVRSMRLHAGLPKTSWANAVSTATYLIN